GSERDENGNFIPLGNQTPDFTLSVNNNISFSNFELSFLWDWQQGNEVVNLGKLIMDLGGTSPDFDEIGTFIVEDEAVEMRRGVGRLTVLGSQTAPYVESATYLKLRELSLSYSVPRSLVRSWFAGQVSYLRFGIAARNLLMFTGYDG
ncbi:SusC/RagA family TonB-linked outer membrane protein, partial [candidate division KSB1 bacterium]|nr:SusC/RagA family TonB-linked outer membrane protein [candidate division KSB1 bacterium]NIS26267.1 SusC/RagA family TonB-linked outer membrane protein [candidate division KSB1 bacterium]NIT73029.1 SusC/RagA family TonB-linked outer membrane protein [candidate division KSB1 bacterium]NIU26916.1 SusC/RagA family TonB-linked outer membrane protein [candidate division KSB1 bacterium]NIU89990.1 SusC/RagA family TonB-linked outer membrane protein [candidate division KSB1 bacterium]